VLSLSQRQQVEGYLAWKWGLNGQLNQFNPTSISGCQLWLDAADSSTIGGFPTNGDFEADNVSGYSGGFNYRIPSGWSGSATPPVVIYNATGVDNGTWSIRAYSGNNCLGLQGATYIYQSVGVTSGNSYILTWYQNSRDTTAPNDLKVSVDGNVVSYQSYVYRTTSAIWNKKQSVAWRATSSSAVIKFETTNPLRGDCTTFLDFILINTNSNGDSITTWVDKSGNGYHATGYSNPTYDTSGKRISVNGSNYFWNTTMPFNLSARTIFLVFEEGSYYGGARGIMGFIPNPPTSGADYNTNNSMTIESNNGIRFYQNGQYSPFDMGVNPLPKAIYCDTLSGSTGYGLINGSLRRTSTASVTFGSSIGYDIAARWNGSAISPVGISGYYYEIIVFNTSLTTAQRQQVEGYLSNKWGVTIANYSPSILHPYATLPPSSVRDTTAATPTVFLQALGYSGSGTWYDKSPNGFNATLESGTAAKNSAGNGIVLNGSTNWTFPNISAGNKWSFVVWYKNTGAPVGNYACLLTQIITGNYINISLGYPYGDNGTFRAGFYYSGAWYNGGDLKNKLTNNVWINIIATWDGTTLSTYINGSLLGSTTPGGTSVDAGNAYRIGQSWNAGDYMIGQIGEVVIYKQIALTKAQIYNEYISRAYIYSY
jgi:hypothetical protein